MSRAQLVLLSIGAAVVALSFAIMAVLGVGVFQRSTANFRGRTSAIERTRGNGAFRVAQYDWFFNQCAAVQTQEGRLKVFASDTSPIGLTNSRAVAANRLDLINEYNARASATGTSGQFRASSLPFHLDPNSEHTTCD